VEMTTRDVRKPRPTLLTASGQKEKGGQGGNDTADVQRQEQPTGAAHWSSSALADCGHSEMKIAISMGFFRVEPSGFCPHALAPNPPAILKLSCALCRSNLPSLFLFSAKGIRSIGILGYFIQHVEFFSGRVYAHSFRSLVHVLTQTAAP
jgi:hypothetical protein